MNAALRVDQFGMPARVPFDLPGAMLAGVWFAEPDEARASLPWFVDDVLNRDVWQEFVPQPRFDDGPYVFGEARVQRVYEDAPRWNVFGVVLDFQSDWGPARMVLPEVHVPGRGHPYVMSLQLSKGVREELSRRSGHG